MEKVFALKLKGQNGGDSRMEARKLTLSKMREVIARETAEGGDRVYRDDVILDRKKKVEVFVDGNYKVRVFGGEG